MTEVYIIQNLTLNMLILSPNEYISNPITRPTRIINITSLPLISSI